MAYVGRFIPRYFTPFDAMIYKIVSVVPLSDISLLVSRNATDFSTLIWYPGLPNSLMSSNSFQVASLGFSMYNITSSANSDSLSSFPFGFLLLLFLFLTAMARTSKTMLNKSSESGHPFLVSDLRGNALCISPLSMMLAVHLSYVACIMLRHAPSLPTF